MKVLALLSVLFAFEARADDWLGGDKALHAAASSVLVLGGYGALLGFDTPPAPAVRLTISGGVALSVGVLKELVDLAGFGTPSWKDLAWDAIGTAIGVGFSWLIDQLVVRHVGARSLPAAH